MVYKYIKFIYNIVALFVCTLLISVFFLYTVYQPKLKQLKVIDGITSKWEGNNPHR